MGKVTSFVSVLMTPVIKQRALFCFSILMSIGICCTGLLKGAEVAVLPSIILPICDGYVFCLIAYLLQKIKLHLIVWIIVVVTLFGELFTVLYYHTTFSLYVIQLILDTNRAKSGEFLSSVIHLWPFWQTLLISLFAGGVSYQATKVHFSSHLMNSFILLLTSGLVILAASRQVEWYIRLVKCWKSESLAYISNTFYRPHLHSTAVRFAYGYILHHTSTRELQTLALSVTSIPVDSCSFRCPLIVMILGESYNKHHCQIYEKDIPPTTPFMIKRLESGNLIAYNDVVTKYNITAEVFKSIFCTWDEDNGDVMTDHTFFPALFKKAGYQVLFLSNQFLLDNNTQNFNHIGGMIFDHELSDLLFTSRNSVKYQYDGELLSEIPTADILTSCPTLCIIHLLGQHVKYSLRYPKSFEKFKASESKAKFGGYTGRKIDAEYNNAVLYNDWVVEQIVSRLDSLNAICLYFADHGEEVFDWRNQCMRSQEKVITPGVARYQYEIPMMFFISDTFKKNHPDIVQAVEAGVDKPLISSDISNILLYLGGINTKEYKSTRNVLSPDYIPRKRLLRGTQDYDEIMHRLFNVDNQIYQQ